ncbi:hypothetical protein GDO78_015196 [Eleutherodactylus coqui]|uniref:Uncharacterized protein n=1 Tax=Eleutherodactylus coqui TaxID=57060 RepID=A0A8J6EDT2_ELECQ|nr:hypothetical protein GDO78_015196 [Eleutherodactylus coqui]
MLHRYGSAIKHGFQKRPHSCLRAVPDIMIRPRSSDYQTQPMDRSGALPGRRQSCFSDLLQACSLRGIWWW